MIIEQQWYTCFLEKLLTLEIVDYRNLILVLKTKSIHGSVIPYAI